MTAYILRRLLLILPTLFGILLINFLIVQAAPGGPVEQMIAQLQGFDLPATSRISGGGSDSTLLEATEQGSNQRHALSPDMVAKIEKQYGFDKPATQRFLDMVANYLRFDLGQSFYRSISVTDLIVEKLPVSISLGLWSTLLVYLLSIPLGIYQAKRQGSRVDTGISLLLAVGYAIPGFLFAMALIVVFAGGSWWQWFPLRGLVSDNFDELSLLAQIKDYFWHLVLPITAITIGHFATLTLLTRNSFLEEIRRQYVITARAKGLKERHILLGHIFRNAMLLIVSGVPAALLGIFFTSSLLVEIIFSLDGLGLLGFEAVLQRDYPVVFGTLYIFTLTGMVVKLLGDLACVAMDPRIHFHRESTP